MAMKKILVTSSEYPAAGLNILKERFQIVQSKYNGFDKSTLEENKKELERLISDVDAAIWSTKIPLGKQMLDKAGPQLKVVSAMSAGVDHIDVAELKARGIALTNTPHVLNGAVADMCVMLMIGAARRLPEGIQQCKTGNWLLGPSQMLGQDIRGSTVGIIGLGGVGRTIVKRLQGFEVKRFIYCGNTRKADDAELGATFVTFEELLAQSDFVVLSCSLNASTRHLMNAEAFSKMKNSSILINVSRGDTVDQDALISALRSKQIWAAGLDVTSPEPLPADNPLTSLPNCLLTPHLGSATKNTRDEMAMLAARNAICAIDNKPLLTPV